MPWILGDIKNHRARVVNCYQSCILPLEPIMPTGSGGHFPISEEILLAVGHPSHGHISGSGVIRPNGALGMFRNEAALKSPSKNVAILSAPDGALFTALFDTQGGLLSDRCCCDRKGGLGRYPLIVKLWFLPVIASARLLTGQSEFYPANVTATSGPTELRLFPAVGTAAVIKLPFSLGLVKFDSDGRSLYASLRSDLHTKTERMPGLVRIEFNPIRSTPVAGTQGFAIKDFAVTQDHRKIVVSGHHREEGREKCGLWEITPSTGSAKRVLAVDCAYQWSWTDLTLSPEGDRAIASYGNTHTDHNYRLELIDLARGATKSLGNLDRATWSPDGKWIAAIEWGPRKRLILLDANNLSDRRDIGSTVSTAWSPDSRYLLTWKWHFLKCGIGIDVEPPASFEVLEIASGKRSLIRSSQCQLIAGPIGWIFSDIQK